MRFWRNRLGQVAFQVGEGVGDRSLQHAGLVNHRLQPWGAHVGAYPQRVPVWMCSQHEPSEGLGVVLWAYVGG